jgi:Cdc6-like AAA superfamily ATPase
MTEKNHAFPWGVYIGNFMTRQNESFPVCLPANQGGFCTIFDSSSENVADNFIENVALQLLNALPAGDLCVDVFDFDHRLRFKYLSQLQEHYTLSLNAIQANQKFDALEQISQTRHHSLLSHHAPTLSEYNQQNSKFIEKYHVLMVNLDDFPHDSSLRRRLAAFFDSPLTAGFYFIGFGSEEILSTENRATQYLRERFPILAAKNQEIALNNSIFPLAELAHGYDFHYVNENKSAIIERLKSVAKTNNTNANNITILSTPIGKTADGRNEVNFVLGSENANYHAFITGMAGTGKTTLLNNIILSVAENYTAQQIRLYLMDYKEGVEFGIFENHPNCEKIFLDNQDTQAAIDLLEEFSEMITERGKLFIENRVQDIQKYNDLFPDKPLHRIILIIDEVHRLFVGTYNQRAKFSGLLEDVVRRGRAFGLHIILATQSLLNSDVSRAIMSQITLRLSFKLVDPIDSEKIFMTGNTTATTLKKYELIYNNDAGQITANVLCRTNGERNIEATISQIRLTRENNQMITPVIAKSQPKPIVPTPTVAQPMPVTPVTPSQSEKDNELLNRFCPQFDLKKPNEEA